MRGLRRVVALAVACSVAVGVGVAMGAHARAAAATSTQRVTVVRSNWYWQQVADSAGVGVLPVPEPSNVPAGDLAVASDVQGNPTKEAYVALGTGSLPSGATVSGAHVVLAVDQTQTQLAAAAPALVACLPRSSWGAGAGSAWANRPQEDCAGAVAGAYDGATMTYTFSLTGAMATAESLAGAGIAIRGPLSSSAPATAPFQLDLAAPATVVATLDVVLPVTVQPTAAAPSASAEATSAPVAAVGPSVRAPAAAAPSARPSAAAAPAPVVSVPASAAGPTVLVITRPHIGGFAAPPAMFLALGLVIAVVLAGLAGAVHGDSPDPAAILARRRLARAAAVRRSGAPDAARGLPAAVAV